MEERKSKLQPEKETKPQNDNIAVIKLGGKQFIVKEGSVIKVEKQNQEPKKILPTEDLLSGKKVTYQIIEDIKDKKISHIKFRHKTRYTKRIGHRQTLTVVKIESIK